MVILISLLPILLFLLLQSLQALDLPTTKPTLSVYLNNLYPSITSIFFLCLDSCVALLFVLTFVLQTCMSFCPARAPDKTLPFGRTRTLKTEYPDTDHYLSPCLSTGATIH